VDPSRANWFWLKSGKGNRIIKERGTMELRRVVWEEMIFANMRANYFAELVSHYQKIEKTLRVVSLVSSSGAAATVLTAAPDWIKIGFPIIAAFVSLWLLFSQYGMMSRDAADLHVGWDGLAGDYERLWNHLEDPNAEALYYQIYERGESLSKTGTRFPNRKKRVSYWMDHSEQLLSARYSA
jgi:hypothetical protein